MFFFSEDFFLIHKGRKLYNIFPLKSTGYKSLLGYMYPKQILNIAN